MIRKRDRVIGTLAVWLGILFTLAITLDRMNGVTMYMQNNWYNFGNVVTGASSEEATQILQTFQSMSNNLYFQAQGFARAEMLAYLPYFALLGLLLLAGGVLSTLFIWRSVIVPDQLHETIAARIAEEAEDDSAHAGQSDDARSLASLLDDNGELPALDPDGQPMPTQKQEQS